jgi:hypothetical protein
VAEALAKLARYSRPQRIAKADRERFEHEALAIKAFRKVSYDQTTPGSM